MALMMPSTILGTILLGMLLFAADAALGDDLPVDLELVLAVDVSGSVDAFEARQQRGGYIDAITSDEVIGAIQGGGLFQRIAVTYVEWADPGYQRIIVPWQVIEDRESAERFAARLAAASYFPALYTALGDMLAVGAGLFAENGFDGQRQVIDVSGDGPSNAGIPVAQGRAFVLGQGITINGLPILNDRPQPVPLPTPRDFGLDEYYRDQVIGGDGAFVVVAEGFDAFKDAILQKLVLEIAGQQPAQPLVIPASADMTR